jgi:hypothetical protein
MFVYIREPMVSPKISEKACQMEIVTEMQELRGTFPLPLRLSTLPCHELSRITFGARREPKPSCHLEAAQEVD